jgi:uncharacterized membrane protein YfcA
MWKEGSQLEWILLVLLGLAIGILASMSGLGGGFLVVPVLLYLGKKAQMAVGTSFLVVLLIAVSSVAAHYRLGNIDLKTGLMIALGGIVGAQVGPMLLQGMSEQNFKRFLAGILMLLAIWLVVQSRSAV